MLQDEARIRDLVIQGGKKTFFIFIDDLLIRKRILVSTRRVAFFRKQDITTEGLRALAQKLGELSGNPKESGVSDLRIHTRNQLGFLSIALFIGHFEMRIFEKSVSVLGL